MTQLTYFLSGGLTSNDDIDFAPRTSSENSTPTLRRWFLSFLIDVEDLRGDSVVALTLGCFVMMSLLFFLLTVVLKILMACFRKFSTTKVFASRVFSSSSGLIFNLLLTSEKWKGFSLLGIHLYMRSMAYRQLWWKSIKKNICFSILCTSIFFFKFQLQVVSSRF